MGKRSFGVLVVQALPIVPFLSFGLILAWSQFSNSAYGMLGTLADFGEGYRLANTVSTLANAAALIVAGFCGCRGGRWLLSPRLALICGAVASAASCAALLTSLGAAASDVRLAALCGFYAITGAATGLLFVPIGGLYGRLVGRESIFNLAWSHMLCGALFFIAAGMAHWTLGETGDMFLPALFYCSFPLVAAWLCSLALNREPFDGARYSSDVRDIPSVFWKLVIVILVLCFAMSLTGVVVQGATSEGPMLRARTNNFLRIVIAMILVASVVFARRDRFELGRIYTIIMVSSVAVVTMAPVMDGEVAWWAQLSSIVLLAFRMLHWVILSLIVYQKSISPVLVFGFGAGVQALGNGAGQLVGFAAGEVFASPSVQLVVSVGFTLLIILCAFVLFSEKSLDRLFEQRGDGELDLAELFAPLPSFAVCEEATADRGGAADRWSCEEGGARELGCADKESEPGGRHLLPGAFAQAVEALAQENGLSKRETEVFRLIAMGYNPQTISEKLCISWNTVRGHARNIYAKVGVHSHQELIALVDSRKDRLRAFSTD